MNWLNINGNICEWSENMMKRARNTADDFVCSHSRLKRNTIICLVLILLFMTGCPQTNTKTVVAVTSEEVKMVDILCTTEYDPCLDNNEDIATAPWGADLFSNDPEYLNVDLLLFASALTSTAHDGGKDDPHYGEGYYVSKAYEQLGFQDISLFSYPKSKYNVPESQCGFGSEDYDYAFSIAHKVMTGKNGDFDLLTIIMRGTVTTYESIAYDFFGTMKERPWSNGNYTTYDGYYGFANDVIKAVSYVKKQYATNTTGKQVYLICGHSLGGAAANLVAQDFTQSGEDVYCFTFGALNSITTAENEKYKNIWNCMNYYDTFGPNGEGSPIPSGYKPSNGGSTFYNKFGNVGINRQYYVFSAGDKRYANHHMKSYYLGAKDNLYNFGVKISPDHEPAESEEQDHASSEENSSFDIVGLWVTNDGTSIEFTENGKFYFDWGFGFEEEGSYSLGESTGDKSFLIDLDGTSLILLMNTLYGMVDNSYHFEILINDKDTIYLVQVYGEFTAATSGCKLMLKRSDY